MPAPFVLLMLAIAAVWLPSVRLGAGWTVAPWAVVFAVATGTALAQGFVGPVGVGALVALVLLAALLRRQTRPALSTAVSSAVNPSPNASLSPALGPALGTALYWATFVALLVLTVALCLHAVPGFKNPVAIDAVKFSEDGRAFTQYLNFDKGSVGLVLLALLAPRLQRSDAGSRTIGLTLLMTLIVALAALGLATALGMIRWDPKWPPQTLQFLVTNLLLTCVAEEALFRCMVQDRLAFGSRAPENTASSALHRWGGRSLTALAVSALLFGAAHAGAGPGMMGVATVAGLGYAAAYQWHRRIEAAVLMHFGINALHFVLMTYPAKA